MLTDDNIMAIAGTDELTGDAIINFARAIIEQAAPVAPSYIEPKFTDEELQYGGAAIRWVTAKGVFGRPMLHDVLDYIERRGEAIRCTCDRCKTFAPALPSPGAEPATPPFYISGPYHDGRYSICELGTARILQKLDADDFPPQLRAALQQPASDTSAEGGNTPYDEGPFTIAGDVGIDPISDHEQAALYAFTHGTPHHKVVRKLYVLAYRAVNSEPASDTPTSSEEGAATTERADAERLDWLERNLFDRKWDGTIGRASSWSMVGPYRHTMQKMHGETLRSAVDAARQAGQQEKP